MVGQGCQWIDRVFQRGTPERKIHIIHNQIHSVRSQFDIILCLILNITSNDGSFGCSVICTNIYSECTGGSKGGARTRVQILSISCIFWGKFTQIICWRPPLEGLRPYLGEILDLPLPCYFVHWQLIQCLTQSSVFSNRDTIFGDNCL